MSISAMQRPRFFRATLRRLPVPPLLVVMLLIPTLLLCGLLTAAPAAAQRIQGEVLDLATRQPVAGALVILSDTSGSLVRRAVSGTDGRFALDNLAKGPLRVEVEALGYASSAPRSVDFDGQPLFLEIGLEPAAVGVEGIRVSVKPQQPYLRDNGFYERLRRGHGRFVTEEDIARLRPVRASEIVRRVHSVTLQQGEPVFTRGSVGLGSRNDCLPNIYVDGVAVRLGAKMPRTRYTGLSGPHSLSAFDNMVPPPEAIRALEVYTGGAGTPAQWRGSSSACGVIVVWTKH